MKLVAATIYALRIPFVEAFSHSATERRWSDSVVVRVRDDAGTEGFGEGVPRPYVTGETVETMLAHLAESCGPASRAVSCPHPVTSAGSTRSSRTRAWPAPSRRTPAERRSSSPSWTAACAAPDARSPRCCRRGGPV